MNRSVRAASARRLRLLRRATALAVVTLAWCTLREARADDPTSDATGDVDRPRAGVAQGVTTMSSAFEFAKTGSGHGFRVGGEFEHMLRNRWGLVGSLSIPVSGPWVAPGTMGLRVHALPGHAVDPFLTFGGGFAWVNPTNVPADLVPMLAMRLGLSLYTTGIYFVQAEGGYDFVHYSHAGLGFDLSGLVATGRAGFYF
jgi:hypothetical protein